MRNRTLKIGARGSSLALWQAGWVRASLLKEDAGLDVTVTVIKTTGDRVLDSPLSDIGDKGLFTKEIEIALLRGEVDLAVHSLKDLPTQLPDGLRIGAVMAREDVRDVFIPHPNSKERSLSGLCHDARIATGSLRRQSQILNRWPGFSIIDLRGNLDTRFRKLDESSWDGMLLAAAGVRRLGLDGRIGEYVDPLVLLPAVGQGALAVEIRSDDPERAALIEPLNDTSTAAAVAAERALLRALEGGCQIPIGAWGRIPEGGSVLRLEAYVGSLDGSAAVRGEREGSPEEADAIGIGLAQDLQRKGASGILEGIRSASSSEHRR